MYYPSGYSKKVLKFSSLLPFIRLLPVRADARRSTVHTLTAPCENML
jgi:hypothetical protein